MPKDDDERKLSKEELILWKYVSDSVTPLDGKKVIIPEEDEEVDIVEDEKGEKIFKEIFESNKIDKKTTPKTNLPYKRPGQTQGIDKKTAKKLKSGKLDIQAYLDLHGMNKNQAFVALNNFINSCYNNNKRCLLVITGKGFKNKNHEGILYNKVPRWLNEPSMIDKILIFSRAKPCHGGQGALYVMLKKNKELC